MRHGALSIMACELGDLVKWCSLKFVLERGNGTRGGWWGEGGHALACLPSIRSFDRSNAQSSSNGIGGWLSSARRTNGGRIFSLDLYHSRIDAVTLRLRTGTSLENILAVR